MSHGSRVWKANGQLSLNITDRLLRLYSSGTFTFTSSATVTTTISVPNAVPNPQYFSNVWRYQDIYIPDVVNDGTFFCYIFAPDNSGLNVGNIAPDSIGYTIYSGFIRFYAGYYLGYTPTIAYKVFKG